MTDAAIRPARPEEAAPVSALALRSKGHWGYDAAFLEACRDELTWTPEECLEGRVQAIEADGELAGCYVLDLRAVPEAELDALFVDPPYIGRGIGKRLLDHALNAAASAGCDTVRLDADPDAEPFYAAQGFRRIGSVPSGSVPGRVLPRLELSRRPG